MKPESQIHGAWPPLLVVLIVLYILSPVDLMPGVVVGWFDDIISGILLVWFLTSWLPRNRHRLYWFRPASSAGGENCADEQAASPDAGAVDPFDVLKIHREASPTEVRRAYREMLMKYHPDRVAHLGKEFQQVAHDKMVEINKAYEMLCGKD